ncbi:hypothetical protein MMC11_006377 [Xylographa trunciseda]|nr:hypothetical protein [Xylographa trunciseda]
MGHLLDPARYSLPIVSESIGINESNHIVMKKPATPINMAAQDPIRTVEAEPVWVAELPATVLVVGDGIAKEPLKAETEAVLVMPVDGDADDVMVADGDPLAAEPEAVADAEADPELETATVAVGKVSNAIMEKDPV